LHAPGRLRKDLPSLAGVTEGRLRTKNPCIHAVVALPSLVAVQMSTTRSQLLKFLQDGPPPGQGTTDAVPYTGHSQRVNLLAAKLSVCLTSRLTLPPVKVLPSHFASRVIRSPEKGCSMTLLRGLCCAAGDLSDPSGIVGASQNVPPNVPPNEAGTCHTSMDVNKRPEVVFQRRNEKSRMYLELCDSINGARERTRISTSCDTRT
jgi:hypothetical protein